MGRTHRSSASRVNVWPRRILANPHPAGSLSCLFKLALRRIAGPVGSKLMRCRKLWMLSLYWLGDIVDIDVAANQRSHQQFTRLFHLLFILSHRSLFKTTLVGVQTSSGIAQHSARLQPRNPSPFAPAQQPDQPIDTTRPEDSVPSRVAVSRIKRRCGLCLLRANATRAGPKLRSSLHRKCHEAFGTVSRVHAPWKSTRSIGPHSQFGSLKGSKEADNLH